MSDAHEGEMRVFDQSEIPVGVDWVYFVRCEGKVKIGHSLSVKSRVRDFATGNPFRLDIIGIEHGGEPREKELQARFHKYRCQTGGREWFELSPEIADHIKKLEVPELLFPEYVKRNDKEQLGRLCDVIRHRCAGLNAPAVHHLAPYYRGSSDDWLAMDDYYPKHYWVKPNGHSCLYERKGLMWSASIFVSLGANMEALLELVAFEIYRNYSIWLEFGDPDDRIDLHHKITEVVPAGGYEYIKKHPSDWRQVDAKSVVDLFVEYVKEMENWTVRRGLPHGCKCHKQVDEDRRKREIAEARRLLDTDDWVQAERDKARKLLLRLEE